MSGVRQLRTKETSCKNDTNAWLKPKVANGNEYPKRKAECLPGDKSLQPLKPHKEHELIY